MTLIWKYLTWDSRTSGHPRPQAFWSAQNAPRKAPPPRQSTPSIGSRGSGSPPRPARSPAGHWPLVAPGTGTYGQHMGPRARCTVRPVAAPPSADLPASPDAEARPSAATWYPLPSKRYIFYKNRPLRGAFSSLYKVGSWNSNGKVVQLRVSRLALFVSHRLGVLWGPCYATTGSSDPNFENYHHTWASRASGANLWQGEFWASPRAAGLLETVRRTGRARARALASAAMPSAGTSTREAPVAFQPCPAPLRPASHL